MKLVSSNSFERIQICIILSMKVKRKKEKGKNSVDFNKICTC